MNFFFFIKTQVFFWFYWYFSLSYEVLIMSWSCLLRTWRQHEAEKYVSWPCHASNLRQAVIFQREKPNYSASLGGEQRPWPRAKSPLISWTAFGSLFFPSSHSPCLLHFLSSGRTHPWHAEAAGRTWSDAWSERKGGEATWTDGMWAMRWMNRLRFFYMAFCAALVGSGRGVEKSDAFDGHLVGGPFLCTLSTFVLLVLPFLHVPSPPKRRFPRLHHHTLSKAFIIKWRLGGKNSGMGHSHHRSTTMSPLGKAAIFTCK